MRGDDPRVQPPALNTYSDVPLYNTKAVVHQTGVPAPTLRAWERRYGILSPQRGGNDYRLYSERDIVTVVWLRERVQGGMTISQAIALLKNLQTDKEATRRPVQSASTSASHGGGQRAVSAQGHAPRYSLTELRDTLLRDLIEFDEVSARRTIAQALAVHTVEDVCVELLAPVMATIGDMWAHGDVNVVAEHFASNLVRSQLESIFRSTGEFPGAPLALVGCAPGELHEMGALMLAVFLRRSGMRTVYLGQSVEMSSLLQTIQALRPAAVVLVAVVSESVRSLSEVAKLIAALRSNGLLFGFGGPAFNDRPEMATSIPGLFLDADLAQAASTIHAHLHG